MYPPVHPVVGYLVYAGFTRVLGRTPSDGIAVPVLVVATLLPDIIDKPLLWMGVVPSGRTLGHSLLFAIPVMIVVSLFFYRRGSPEAGVAFAIGYLSHIAADALWPLVVGASGELGFLLWPLTYSPPYEGQKYLTTVMGIDVTTFPIEIALLVLGLAVWISDGTPGIAYVRNIFR